MSLREPSHPVSPLYFMMGNMSQAAVLFWQKVMLKICKNSLELRWRDLKTFGLSVTLLHKGNDKKNPFGTGFQGFFSISFSPPYMHLTWILQFSGSMTRVLGNFDFHSVKRVEIAKRCRFFVAGLFCLWYHCQWCEMFLHIFSKKLIINKKIKRRS